MHITMKKLFTDEQEQKLYQDYLNNNRSLQSFCKDKNLNYGSVYSIFRRLKLKLIPQEITQRKYPLQKDFFERIDSESKAYFLGFFYADGTIDLNRNKAAISLAKQDEEILIKLSYILLGNNGVKEYKYANEKQPRVTLTIINSEFVQNLNKQGCLQNKTFKLRFPKQLDTKYINHFIRGYFDGDGSITLYKRKNRKNALSAQFSIVSTRQLLRDISKYFNKLKVNSYLSQRHPERNKNNYTLRVSGNRQIEKVLNWLYTDSNIHLTRKYKNYEILLSNNLSNS